MDNGNKSEEISRPVVRLPILIGLLVLVLIYLSVTLPNMDEKLLGYPKMKRSQVLGNMRTCQIAAEAYAQDHSGLYPETINDKAFRSYFPGGNKGFP